MNHSKRITLTGNVLVVDDNTRARQSMADVLRAAGHDVHACASAMEALKQLEKNSFDVIITDLQMPGMNGLEAMQAIRHEFPEACIVVLTTYRGDVQVTNALRHGAMGFLLKATLRKDLRDAIRTVHSGRRVIPPDVAVELAEHVADDMLSGRELEVLRIAARGYANKQIAAELGITEDTVKAHMKSILSKLDAEDRTHAVVTAVKRGIIDV